MATAPPVFHDAKHKPSLLIVSPDAIFPQEASSNVDQQAISSRRDQKKACSLPYVLFAIDGTWQEAKEIYKVDTASAAFCLLQTTADADRHQH